MSPRALRTPLPEPTPIETMGLGDHDKLIRLEAAINEERRARYYLELAVQDVAGQIRWGVKMVMGAVIAAILAGVIVKAVPASSSSTRDRSDGRSFSLPHAQPAESSSSSSDQEPPDGAVRHH